MKLLTIIISLTLILICSNSSHAQQKEKYLYEDSSIVYPDEKDTIIKEATTINDSAEEAVTKRLVDTTLYNNQMVLRSDSAWVLKNEKQFLYAKNLDSLLIKLQQKKDTQHTSLIVSFFSADITKIIFWMIAGLFVLFILYRFFFAEGFFQRQTAKVKVAMVKEEGDTDVLNGADYDKLIANAINSKEYRLAVRWLYLQSLQKLAATGAISFAVDKTNYQYLAEVESRPYKNDFAFLTRQYEYIWYGGFEIDAPLFLSLQNSFRQFNKQL